MQWPENASRKYGVGGKERCGSSQVYWSSGESKFKKNSLNYFSKQLSSELKCAYYCDETYLVTLTGKLDFDQKTLGLHKPNLWQGLETESYAPEKWVLTHYRWREASLFLFSFEYAPPRT